jgi:hypothetical protein
VSPNSSIQYAPTSVEVIQGTARLNTDKGMSVSVGRILVSPKDGVAKFDVVRTENKVVVVSREGVLTVQDGGHTVVVQPGASTELSLGLAAGWAGPVDQGSKTTPATFISDDRLVEHPFYGVVKGIDENPYERFLPVCTNVTECIRPNVSQIKPCCCPPIVSCH